MPVKSAARARPPVVGWDSGDPGMLALVVLVLVLVIEMGAIRLNGLHSFTATEWNQATPHGETVTDGVAHPVCRQRCC